MGPAKNKTFSPTGLLRMRVSRMSLRRTKSAIISWDGSLMKTSMSLQRTVNLGFNCRCPFPVWCLGQDVEFDCIGS